MQLFINKTLLFALIRAKYPNYNLVQVKVFNGYPVTLNSFILQCLSNETVVEEIVLS